MPALTATSTATPAATLAATRSCRQRLADGCCRVRLVPRRVSVRPATGRQNAKTKRNFKIILSLISKEFRIYISNIAVKVSATRRRSWDSCNLHNFSNSCSLYNLSKIYLQSAVALAAAAAASPAAMQVFDNNMVSRQTCVTYIGHTKIDMYMYLWDTCCRCAHCLLWARKKPKFMTLALPHLAQLA